MGLNWSQTNSGALIGGRPGSLHNDASDASNVTHIENHVFGGRIRGTQMSDSVDTMARQIADEFTNVFMGLPGNGRKNREQVWYLTYSAAKNSAAKHLDSEDLLSRMRAGSANHLSVVDIPDSVDHHVSEDHEMPMSGGLLSNHNTQYNQSIKQQKAKPMEESGSYYRT